MVSKVSRAKVRAKNIEDYVIILAVHLLHHV